MPRLLAGAGEVGDHHFLDDGSRRSVAAKTPGELVEGGDRASRLEHDTAPAVRHPAGHAELGGEPVHEGPEAHSLHGARHHDAASDCALRSDGGRRHSHSIDRISRFSLSSSR